MVFEYREYLRKPLLTVSDRPSALSSQVDPEFRDILQPLQEDYGAVKKKEDIKWEINAQKFFPYKTCKPIIRSK